MLPNNQTEIPLEISALEDVVEEGVVRCGHCGDLYLESEDHTCTLEEN